MMILTTTFRFKWILIICLILVGISCKPNPAKTENVKNEQNVNWKNNKNSIVYASTMDIRDINPHLYLGEMSAQNMVFESLVLNTKNGIKPHLAEYWDISKDGKTYTFYLRKNVFFTNGEKFNANAVKLNFDAIMSNAARHAWLEMVNQIDSTSVIDEYTFQIQLKNAYYPTLVELGLTRPFRFISPNDFVNGETKNGVNNYHGTGPWILTEHKKNAYAVFDANKNYWGGSPAVNSVRWLVMPDPQTILLALEKGELDLVFETDGLVVIDNDTYSNLSQKNKYTTLMSPPLASRALVLNTTKPILKDKAVRKALQFAINKESLNYGIFNNTEVTATTLMPKTTPYCDVDITTYEYDLDRANQLLNDAGWLWDKDKHYRVKDGIPLHFELSYINRNAIERTLSQAIQADLKQIGAKLILKGEEKQIFLDRQRVGDFDIQYVVSWGTPYDPQSYVSSFRVPAHADYHAQLGLAEKPQLDEWIAKLLITPDEKLRQALYYKVFATLADEAVYIPLTYSRIKIIHSKRLNGVEFNPSQYEIPFEKMYFE